MFILHKKLPSNPLIKCSCTSLQEFVIHVDRSGTPQRVFMSKLQLELAQRQSDLDKLMKHPVTKQNEFVLTNVLTTLVPAVLDVLFKPAASTPSPSKNK